MTTGKNAELDVLINLRKTFELQNINKEKLGVNPSMFQKLKMLTIGTLGLIVSACTFTQSTTEFNPFDGFVSLTMEAGGSHVCSGVFIDSHTILSAKHCFTAFLGPAPAVATDQFGVKHTFKDIKLSKVQDIAILTIDDEYLGPTKKYSCVPPEVKDRLWVVGTPSQFVDTPIIVELIVAAFQERQSRFNTYNLLASGVLLPGMSGGPWYNQAGEVVGVSSYEYYDDEGTDSDLNGSADLSKTVELCKVDG